METIVILSDRSEVDYGFVRLLEELFPESRIRILSKTTGSLIHSSGAPGPTRRDTWGEKDVEHFDYR